MLLFHVVPTVRVSVFTFHHGMAMDGDPRELGFCGHAMTFLLMRYRLESPRQRYCFLSWSPKLRKILINNCAVKKTLVQLKTVG